VRRVGIGVPEMESPVRVNSAPFMGGIEVSLD